MKSPFIIIACLCAIAFAVLPAEALTMKTLTINLEDDGDAQVDLRYDLSLPEQGAVMFQITDLRGTLERDLQQNLNRPVSVRSAGMDSANITITGLASVSTREGATVMAMPGFSLGNAENVMKQYWYAPLTSPDFSPEVTAITFPDGYTEYYYDQIHFPTITRTL